MAQLNVFELTNAELSKSLKESAPTAKKSVKRSKKVTESAKIGRKFRTAKKITANKLRVESLRFVEDAEENDEVIDYTPEDDVILVIDPEMDETPETVEDAVDAAEELVGDYVCKCAICGANYVCDCEDVAEDLESEEGECPVCGETGEQIVVGEIAPTEDVAEDDDADNADEATDDEDGDADVDIDINVDDADDEDADFEESLAKARRRTALRRESAKRTRKPMSKVRKESAIASKRPVAKRNVKATMPTKRTRVESAKRTRTVEYNLDEVTLNRMLTKFAKENYENVRFVKITSAKCKNNRLTLEGVVVTKKGSKRSTKFVAENFKPSKAMTVNFKEIGAFTESAISKTPAFTINFNMDRNVITPVALRYKYDVKENKATYRVEGKVMNESVKTRKPAPKRVARKSVSESRKPSRRPAKRTK